jgi:hypothetical protein
MGKQKQKVNNDQYRKEKKERTKTKTGKLSRRKKKLTTYFEHDIINRQHKNDKKLNGKQERNVAIQFLVQS